ncbi:MAG: FKBP-type peptidyl-prolyl cis-trans isomerase [Alphaproteobacteria bacterium]
MKNLIFVFAALTLVACGDNSGKSGDSGVMQEIERAERQDAQKVADAAGQTQHFLDAARARPGVIARPSGLLMEFTHHSSNASLPRPTAESVVLVQYEGKLPDGTTFDSSLAHGQPAQFPLNQVVSGFSEAIQQMRPGDEIIAYFPPALGYGERGQPPIIPPNSALQFRIQLLAFQAPGGRLVRAPAR